MDWSLILTSSKIVEELVAGFIGNTAKEKVSREKLDKLLAIRQIGQNFLLQTLYHKVLVHSYVASSQWKLQGILGSALILS